MLKPLVSFALAVCMAGCTTGSPKLDATDQLMRAYAGDAPGAALLILKDGKPVLSRSYGYADLEAHAKVTPETNFRLASITKQFTAAAILLLRQDGRLHLDDPVRKWLPELPENDAGITLAQLLTHTGGIVDYEDLIPPGSTEQLSDADVLRLLSAAHTNYFKPGSAYRYSNSGYVLLGLVVARASGMSLPAFLHERIFAPLGMTQTLMYVKGGPDVAHRAYGYSRENHAWLRTDQDTTSATLGDGGIYSSVADLAKWDAALYDDRLLDAESRELAFSPHVKVVGEAYAAEYGYGWRITGDSLWHSGESIGFRNVIVRWPQRHLTLILLSNRNHPRPYETALAIARPFLASADGAAHAPGGDGSAAQR